MDLHFKIISVFFFISTQFVNAEEKRELGFLKALEEKLELKLNEYSNHCVKWLEEFNDRHLGKSEIGRFLHYEEIKPRISETGRQEKSMKKMGMAMMPLVFHIGATSTWMVLTTIMAAKSVVIGLLLLVFKIAVSSAKLASFFTLLKSKSNHHHDWSWAPPHMDHHGHDRSLRLTDIDSHPVLEDWNSYNPNWTPNDISSPFKSVPEYKTVDFPSLEEPEYEQAKKIDERFG